MLNLDWKVEENPVTKVQQLVARVTGKLESVGSKLLESKKGKAPYYLNTITVTDKDGTVAEDMTAMFYPGDKNRIEDCKVGKSYLAKVIWTPGADDLLFCSTALIAGNRVKAGSDADFDALFAKITASANAELQDLAPKAK
jgi:hypothetical protein